MKELSIKEKVRLYDETIERANNLHKDAVEMENNMTTKTCEIIFPELKESDDERIRKSLINYVYCHGDAGDFTKKDFIAWLEKQGEFKWKPSDEQINGIECAIKTLQFQLNVGDKRLDLLYNDLKKLREE